MESCWDERGAGMLGYEDVGVQDSWAAVSGGLLECIMCETPGCREVEIYRDEEMQEC